MFKKLRIQFIAVVMMSVAIVLGVVFSVICYNEYQKSMNDVSEALSSSLDRVSDGLSGPGGDQYGNREPRRPEGALGDSPNEGGMFGGPQIGGDRGGKGSIVPVAVYMVSSDESYTIVSAFTTAQIDSDVLSEASTRINSLDNGFGTFNDLGLHYEKRTTVNATYVAFADTSSTSSWESLAVSLLIAAIAILVVFFVISFFLSNWALRPVKEAWESQKQFVADASHELKTPLTVILANNSILLKHSQDSIASQSQWIESTQVEAQNMQGLVNEMLELAQVESRAAIEHSMLDFSDLVDGIALQFESVAFERGCEYRENVKEGLLVDGDESRLRKAVSTLIENALKYVDEKGVVTITLSANDRKSILEISNTGTAISKEDIPHIFDRFYRTDKARTSGTGGYGLGLAIAREIAREHNGDITCESNEKAGTVFTMTLPLVIVK